MLSLETTGGRQLSLLDPKERAERGARNQAELLAAPAPEPATLFESAWRDFVFAEVWTRPELDRRSRYLIAMASAACLDMPAPLLDGYVRGALALGELSLVELREAALQLAVYAGWGRGARLDASITRAAEELGLPPAPIEPIRAQPWDPAVRQAEGAANFKTVMTISGPKPDAPYNAVGILNFVFGEMWTRPGLDQRGRRWVTLVGVAASAAPMPIRSHIYSAMKSGDATFEEMNEFVLQYAVHGGWPMSSFLNAAVAEQAGRVRDGLPFVP